MSTGNDMPPTAPVRSKSVEVWTAFLSTSFEDCEVEQIQATFPQVMRFIGASRADAEAASLPPEFCWDFDSIKQRFIRFIKDRMNQMIIIADFPEYFDEDRYLDFLVRRETRKVKARCLRELEVSSVRLIPRVSRSYKCGGVVGSEVDQDTQPPPSQRLVLKKSTLCLSRNRRESLPLFPSVE